MRQMRRALMVVAVVVVAFLVSTPPRAALCDGISSVSHTPLSTVRVAAGLTKPLYVTAPSGDTNRIFVLEQDGRIRIVKDGVLLAASFLDINTITRSPLDGGGNEEGLLGMAFSPQYATDGLFFIYHTDSTGGANLLARYQVSANPDLADDTTRTLVLTIPHPTNSNHNGGNIQFGPDGYLYVGPGDGGSSCDPPSNAQCVSQLKGKMLRLDVIPAPIPPDPPYRIPADNPGGTWLPEVFAIGLRNPWRFSFDRLTNDLYIGDVGQDTWEEIDYSPAPNAGRGANYGWDCCEGCVCPASSCGSCPAAACAACPSCACAAVSCSPSGGARVDPVKVYSLVGTPCAVSGGYVYRGCRMPGLASQGRYFYADYCAATVSSFLVAPGACGSGVSSEISYTAELSPSVGGFTISAITSWGEDARGELYIVDRGGLTGAAGMGEVFKVVPVLRNFEVSKIAEGSKVAPFLLTPTQWTWEDLALSSSHPIDAYRIYRHDGAFSGSPTFTCVFKTPPVVPPARPATVWAGGDAANPFPKAPDLPALFSYVVTAVRNTPFEETSPGTGTGGTPRTLSPNACP